MQGCKHTERQAARQVSSIKVGMTFNIGAMVMLGNGSGTHLKRQD